jgi:hypothetical protein
MSHPQGLEPDEVKDEDVITDADVEDMKDILNSPPITGTWNHDNLPPHSNDELFKEKHNL